MSTLTHPLQHISGKDHDRHLRRSWRHCQHWRQNNHQSPLCWWHRCLSRGGKTGNIIWAFHQSLHCLRHGNKCREDQIDDKQHQWHQRGDSHKLQVPGLSCIWRGFQARGTLYNSTDDSNIDKAETSLERQVHFCLFQDRIPCHIHLPVCLWIMDPHKQICKEE